MKKRLILLLAAMLTVSAVALTGCGSNPTVTTADFNEEIGRASCRERVFRAV